MAYLYILYSKCVNKYYVGITTDLPEIRLNKHNTSHYKNQFTSIADDWEIKLSFACVDVKIARKMEQYVKRMKSRKFINKLIDSEFEVKVC
jgi:putative endonuclease